jgi:hypothetical protein
MPMPKGHEVRSAADRFWSKVEKSDECWKWTAGKHNAGYGVFWEKGRFYKAHRWSWERERGPIPDGLNLLHKCDNPACVRPDHLFLGTQKDNVNDMVSKGRHGIVTQREKWPGRGEKFSNKKRGGRREAGTASVASGKSSYGREDLPG